VLAWGGARHALVIPALAAQVAFITLGGGFEPRDIGGRRVDEVCLVLARRASAWRAALDLLRGRIPSVESIEVDVNSGGA
jgi:hypothetical protein